jgi:hypothetical protein
MRQGVFNPMGLGVWVNEGREGPLVYLASLASAISNVPGNSPRAPQGGGPESGAPGESRTPNLLIRSQTLYPIELRVHVLINKHL